MVCRIWCSSKVASLLLLGWCFVFATGAFAQVTNGTQEEAALTQADAEYQVGLEWGARRGSLAPALENAERHYYAALATLAPLPESDRKRELERKVHEQLRLLYQQDGLPLLPWKGWHAGDHDVQLPGLSLLGGVFVSNDPAPTLFTSRMQLFTADAARAASGVRSGGTPDGLSERERWEIVRAPLQTTVVVGASLRQNILGKVSFTYRTGHASNTQVTSYYTPGDRNDLETHESRVAYERVIPVDPLFDLRLAAHYARVSEQGVLEFLPSYEQSYSSYALGSSLSRKLGPGRATLGAGIEYADIPSLPGGSPEAAKRGFWTRDLYAEYAEYAPSQASAFSWGTFRPYRTVTSGFASYVGWHQLERKEGLMTHQETSLYAGVHVEGPSRLAFQVEGALFDTSQRSVAVDDPDQLEVTDPTQSFRSVRFLGLTKLRLLRGSLERPVAVTAASLQIAELLLVVPLGWELSVDGPSNFSPIDTRDHGNDYANLSAGTELWLRTLGFEPLGGGTLISVGYNLVDYYEIKKVQHLMHAGIAVGW